MVGAGLVVNTTRTVVGGCCGRSVLGFVLLARGEHEYVEFLLGVFLV